MDMYRLLHPSIAVLISTVSKEGKQNVCAVAWISPVCKDPPIFSFALHKGHLSTEYIKQTGEIVVSIPGEDLIQTVWCCGTNSGKDVDKVKKCDLKLLPSSTVKAHRVEGAMGWIEAKIEQELLAGDHIIFVAKATHWETNNKGSVWDKSPLMHLGGNNFCIFEKTIKA